MAEVLDPGLPLLWSSYLLLAKSHQRLTHNVRIWEVEACRLKCVSNDAANWRNVSPMVSGGAHYAQATIGPVSHLGRREQEIVGPEEQLCL
jgi:hypothetical protein